MDWNSRGKDAPFSQRVMQYQVQPPDILSGNNDPAESSDEYHDGIERDTFYRESPEEPYRNSTSQNKSRNKQNHSTHMHAGSTLLRTERVRGNQRAESNKQHAVTVQDNTDENDTDEEDISSYPIVENSRQSHRNAHKRNGEEVRKVASSAVYHHSEIPLNASHPAHRISKKQNAARITQSKNDSDRDEEEDEDLEHDMDEQKENVDYSREQRDADESPHDADENDDYDATQSKSNAQPHSTNTRASKYEKAICVDDAQREELSEDDSDVEQPQAIVKDHGWKKHNSAHTADDGTGKVSHCECVGIDTKFHSLSEEIIQTLQQNSEPVKSVIETIHNRLEVLCSVHETQKHDPPSRVGKDIAALLNVCDTLSRTLATFSAHVTEQFRDIRADINETNRTLSALIETTKKCKERSTDGAENDVTVSKQCKTQTSSERPIQASNAELEETKPRKQNDAQNVTNKSVVRNVAGWHESPQRQESTQDDSHDDDVDDDDVEGDNQAELVERAVKNEHKSSSSMSKVKAKAASSKNVREENKSSNKPASSNGKRSPSKENPKKSDSKSCTKQNSEPQDSVLPKGSYEVVRSKGGKTFAFVKYGDDDAEKHEEVDLSESEESSDDDEAEKMTPSRNALSTRNHMLKVTNRNIKPNPKQKTTHTAQGSDHETSEEDGTEVNTSVNRDKRTSVKHASKSSPPRNRPSTTISKTNRKQIESRSERRKPSDGSEEEEEEEEMESDEKVEDEEVSTSDDRSFQNESETDTDSDRPKTPPRRSQKNVQVKNNKTGNLFVKSVTKATAKGARQGAEKRTTAQPRKNLPPLATKSTYVAHSSENDSEYSDDS